MTIKSDIEIAQEAKPLPITDIAGSAVLALAPSVSMYSIRYPFLSLPP